MLIIKTLEKRNGELKSLPPESGNLKEDHEEHQIIDLKYVHQVSGKFLFYSLSFS